MTDKEINKRLLKRDLSVFEYIMNEYNKLLWLVAGNVLEKVGTKEDVEDCISEVYLKLLKNPKLFDSSKGSLKSLLTTMVKNQALDRYRQICKKTTIELEDYVTSNDNVLEDIIVTETSSSVLEAINTLKEPDKEIMIRRYLLEEKPKQISEKMNLETKVVENKLYQAKQKLKIIFQQGGSTYEK